MKIEQVPVEKLIEYVNNAKLHSDDQVSKIAASIKEFGFNNPILVDADNGVIAGHGRLLAAKKLELEKVPCIRLAHLSEVQKKAYILADNRLAEIGGGWNEELVKVEMDFLQENNYNLDLTGFDVGEFEQIEKINSSQENDEWVGMPEFNIIEQPFKLIISFDSENDMKNFTEQSQIKNFKSKNKKTWSTCFPWKENSDLSSVEYE